MTDLLVKLYDLPKFSTLRGIEIRRALAPEKRLVVDWVMERFGSFWASECDIAFNRQPRSCFVATKNKKLIGISCHETTARGVFGPLGVDDEHQGRGVGRALALAVLHDMAAQGYAYAVIGGVGKDAFAFYKKVCGATPIEGSAAERGMYKGILSDRN